MAKCHHAIRVPFLITQNQHLNSCSWCPLNGRETLPAFVLAATTLLQGKEVALVPPLMPSCLPKPLNTSLIEMPKATW